jgi:hypothetical protein
LDPEKPTEAEKKKVRAYNKRVAEYLQDLKDYDRRRDKAIEADEKLRQRYLLARAEIYGFIIGQLHPDVLNDLRSRPSGREAMSTTSPCALKLIAAFRNKYLNEGQEDPVLAFDKAADVYESVTQGSMTLLRYVEHVKTVYATYSSAAASKARYEAAYLGVAEEAVMVAEDECRAVHRMLNGIDVSNGTYDQALKDAVYDLKEKYHQPDVEERERFRLACSTLDEAYEKIMLNYDHRQTVPRAGYHMPVSSADRSRGAYAASVADGGGGSKNAQRNNKSSTKSVRDRAPTPSPRAKADGKSKTCSACKKDGHWWREAKCEEGKRWIRENEERAAAKAADDN